MKKLSSFLLALFIGSIIVITISLSLDLCGAIKLPEKLSLKTYLSNTVEVMGLGDNGEIYYPDYEATGIQNLEENTRN